MRTESLEPVVPKIVPKTVRRSVFVDALHSFQVLYSTKKTQVN